MLPILNRIMVAGGLLGIVLVAVLAAQSPGLFSTLEVDGDATFYHSGIIDAHNLHTATGSSTGTGERAVVLPSDYTFTPYIDGDPRCALGTRTDVDGWFVETYDPDRYGEVATDLVDADTRGMAVVGADIWTVSDDGDLRSAALGSLATVDGPAAIPGTSSPDFAGMAYDGTSLLALDRATETGYTRGSIWSVSAIMPPAATRAALPTAITLADVADFAGVTVDADYVWVGVSPGEFWRLPHDLSSATSFTGPADLALTGLTEQGSNLWAASTDVRAGDLWLAGSTPDAIYRSTDNGATWSAAISGPSGQSTVQGIAVARNGDLWTAGNFPKAIYRSTDNGATWSAAISGPIDASGFNLTGIAVARNGDLWTAGNNPNAVFRSTDNGATWSAAISGPSGQSAVQGIAFAENGDLWLAGGNPRSIYRSTDNGATWSAAMSGPSGQNQLRGIAVARNGDLWAAGFNPNAIFRSTDNGATWSAAISGPSGQSAINGIGIDPGPAPSLWQIDKSAIPSGISIAIPTEIRELAAVSANRSDLWVSDVASGSLWRLAMEDPRLTSCAGSTTVNWRYMTASDNPYFAVRRSAAGEVVELWQSEDPPMTGRALAIRPWETTTDTVTSPGPPPTATLTALYATADTDDRTAALQALSAYVSSRGWLSGVSAVGDIANVPERGCGAPGGDCEPASRLHALRALAAAAHPDAPDAVFALVSESLRVDAAGMWSVAP